MRNFDFLREVYRLGLIPYLFDDDERIAYIKNLSSFAKAEDLEKLRAICKSEIESDELKRIAREVLDLKNEQKPSDAIEEKPSFCNRLIIAWKILRNIEQ